MSPHNPLSDEVIILLYIVFSYLQKVEAVISPLIVAHRPDQPLELVDIKGLRTETVIVERVNYLLLDEVKQTVPVKVHILGPDSLDEPCVPQLPVMWHILAVALDPPVLNHVPLVVVVVH